MKKLKYLLVLIYFVMTTITGFCNTSSLCSKIQLQDAGSVSNQANKSPSYGGGFEMDPFMNSMLNGYSNMIQGSTQGGYSAQEQIRQQMDYAKTQTVNHEEDGE